MSAGTLGYQSAGRKKIRERSEPSAVWVVLCCDSPVYHSDCLDLEAIFATKEGAIAHIKDREQQREGWAKWSVVRREIRP